MTSNTPRSAPVHTVRPLLFAYASALLFIGVADVLWIGVLMAQHYRDWIGTLMLEQPRMLPAVAFYLLYPVGIAVFAVRPALHSGRIMTALGLGALYGLLAYGTYDLSNLATLKGWPVELALVDLAWGTLLSASAAAVALTTARAAQRRFTARTS